jgi:hypothetical protein
MMHVTRKAEYSVREKKIPPKTIPLMPLSSNDVLKREGMAKCNSEMRKLDKKSMEKKTRMYRLKMIL